MDIKELKDQIIERLKDIKEYSIEYILIGFTEVEDWYGNIGFFTLNIHTNEEGFKEIQKDPLQDYSSYGAKNVNYAYFEVIKRFKIEGNYLNTTLDMDLEPIEAGEKQSDFKFEDTIFIEPEVIYY